MFWRRLLRDPGGATMVEAAVILPVFLVLTFGIVEVALALFQWKSAEKAVQLGARMAVVSAPAVALPAQNFKRTGTEISGQPCRLASDPCAGFTGQCTGTACLDDTNQFTHIFNRMREVYPWLEADDVVIQYDFAGLGYVGGPPVPAVTVTISRPFNFVILDTLLTMLPGGGAIGQLTNFKSATLTGEDQTTHYDFS